MKWCSTLRHGIPSHRLAQRDRKHPMDCAPLPSTRVDVSEMRGPCGKRICLSHHEEKSTVGLSLSHLSHRLSSLSHHHFSTVPSRAAPSRVLPARGVERGSIHPAFGSIEPQPANHLEPAPRCARPRAFPAIEDQRYPMTRLKRTSCFSMRGKTASNTRIQWIRHVVERTSNVGVEPTTMIVRRLEERLGGRAVMSVCALSRTRLAKPMVAQVHPFTHAQAIVSTDLLERFQSHHRRACHSEP